MRSPCGGAVPGHAKSGLIEASEATARADIPCVASIRKEREGMREVLLRANPNDVQTSKLDTSFRQPEIAGAGKQRQTLIGTLRAKGTRYQPPSRCVLCRTPAGDDASNRITLVTERSEKAPRRLQIAYALHSPWRRVAGRVVTGQTSFAVAIAHLKRFGEPTLPQVQA